jgi:hypothetical protein
MIVGVQTDSGLVGYGEVCPLGPFYLPAYRGCPNRDRGMREGNGTPLHVRMHIRQYLLDILARVPR